MRMKKRVLSLLLAAVLALTALPGAAFAEEPENSPEVPDVSARAAETGGGCGEYEGRIGDSIPYVYVWSQSLTWTLDSDGTLTISGSGEMGDFVFEEYGNTIIRPWDAVKDSIKKVVVEEGVPAVSDYAFFNCEALTEVEVAGSVRSIGENAFSVCGKLTRAVIRPGSGCSLGDHAFSSCSALTDLSLGEGVSFLGLYAFSGCSSLTDVSLPESIRTVGSYSFYSCTGLTGIVLPEHTEKVGYDAFEGCESLKKVTAPEGLALPPLPSGTETETYTGPTPGTGGGTGENPGGNTGENPGGNTGENPGGNTGENPGGNTGENPGGNTGENPGGNTGENPGGNTGENPGGNTGENPGGNTGENPGGDTPVTPPPAEIVSSGSCGKTGTSVSYTLNSNGLLTIRGTGEMKDYSSYSAAPWSKEDVRGVVIEEGVTSVGAYAFYNCGTLESVKLPESLTAIGSNAFRGCAALPSADIPQAVTSLGYNAFMECGSLKKARVPLGLKKNVRNAFPADCEVTYFGSTGGDCGKVKGTVTWTLDAGGLLTIRGKGEMAGYSSYSAAPWSGEDVRNVVVEEGVTSVGAYAFYNCAALESARLPESLTTIGAYAFYGCAALSSVTIPQAVTSLGYGAFQNCSGLKEARVPLRLKKSAQNAFSADCEVTYYGTTGGECGKNGNNVTWTLDGDGLLTIQGTGEMKDYRPYIAESPWSKETVKAVVVREGVTKVGDLAFGDLTALESAELPEGLTAIGNNAFNGCTALTEITLPRSLERVAGTAFLHSGLTRARVYYKTVFGSSQFPTDASAFPGDCLVSLYGKELTPGTPLRASRTAPAGSDNIHAGSGVECSYLAAGDDGGFYRVNCDSRYNPDKRGYDYDLVMEEYGPGGAFYQGWDIPMELDLFGGFYAGSDGFYFVFGQNNTRESDSVEVLRVVKYSKDLERLGAARLMGGNTQYPFDAASCRMAEGNGLLNIHTGHQMYKSEDGYNHQACMTLAVDTSVMEFQYQFYDILNSSVGYVSHSFDQYVRTDGDRVVRLDLGDGYPRGAALFVNGPNLGGSPDYAVTMKWGGDGGDNNTGSRLGGLEVSGSAYLTALSSVDQTGGRQNNNRTYNVYLLATSKGNLKETRTVQVTHFSEGGPRGAGAPKLVKLSDDRFLLLWEEPERVDYSYGSYYSDYTGTVKYAFFDGAGNQLGGVQSMSGAMSDCQPEVIDGKATWYVTKDGGKPVFYQIGSDGRAGSFTPSSGQKPTGGSVALPGDIKDALADGTAVFAASYSGDRLTGVYQGTVKDGKAVFDRKPPAGRTLYFLDSDGRPLCPPFAG